MPEEKTEELQEISPVRLPGFSRASEPAPPPTEFDYMVLVEIAAAANLREDWVIARLADHGFIVERIDGDIFLFEPSWRAIRAIEETILEIRVASRKANKGKVPEQEVQPEKWAEALFENKLKELRKLAADHDINFMVCWGIAGCPGGLTTAKVKKLSETIHQQIFLRKDRLFAGLYGITYPADQVVPPGNVSWGRCHYETYGQLPDYLIVNEQNYPLLKKEQPDEEVEASGEVRGESGDLLGDHGDDSDSQDVDFADSEQSEDRCDDRNAAGDSASRVDAGNDTGGDGKRDGVGDGGEVDFETLLQNGQCAYDYLTLDLKWDDRNHRLTGPELLDMLEAGAVSKDDLWLLIQLASENGWEGLPESEQVEQVQGEVVEPSTDLVKRDDGVIIDSFTGEVLNLCNMLGFNEEEAAKAAAGFDEKQACRFIEKIRFLQTSTETTIGQAEAIVARNQAAITAGMQFFGHLLRSWAEAKLPRYTKDTKTKKKGDFKEKSVTTLFGDVCFKTGGGVKMARKWEADKWAAEQLRDLNDDVEALVLKRIETLPEPLRSLVKIEFNVKVDRRAAVKAAEAGEQIPGVDRLPKHELQTMLIGTNRKPWSITKPVERLDKRLKELKIACTDKEDDEDAIA